MMRRKENKIKFASFRILHRDSGAFFGETIDCFEGPNAASVGIIAFVLLLKSLLDQ
jgi:hypothetical protein